MITNKEINEALLKKRGYTQYIGNKDNLSSSMYFFLTDASFQVFDKYVSKHVCKGKEKVYMSRMKEAYHLFFKNFFSAFSQEQTEFLLDKVDEFEAHIQHHLDIAEIAIQECYNSQPIEIQKELSRTWLCNLLAADAQDFHGECWRTGSVQPLYDPYIDRVQKASKEYSRLRFGEGPVLTEKQFKRVQLAVKVIARKTAEWIYEDYKREINGNGRSIDAAEVQGPGGGVNRKDEEGVGVRRRDKHKGEALRGGKGDGGPHTDSGGMHLAPGGTTLGPQPHYDNPLRKTYDRLPVVPRVRCGEGTLG